MKIIDNFLDQKEFDELQTFFMGGSKLGWQYSTILDYNIPVDYNELNDEDNFQFVHLFYDDAAPRSPFCEKLGPILNKLPILALLRIKANLLIRTPNIVEQSFHVDINGVPEEKTKQITTSIFYINTNNGYTKFEDGTVVESIANRLVSFPSNMKHTGTSCTDKKIRVVINFNYFSGK